MKRILAMFTALCLCICSLTVTVGADAATYTVNYELDGGTLAEGVANATSFAADTTIAAFVAGLKAPQKDSGTLEYFYLFKGWYADAEYTTALSTTNKALMTTVLAEGATGLTLYAKFKKIEYTYEVDADNNATITDCNIVTADNIYDLVLPSEFTDGENTYPVVAIGDYAFSANSSSFYICTNLRGTLTVPEGVKSIGIGAFKGCQRLEEIVLPESLETIGKDAFSYCSRADSSSDKKLGLKRINIPKNVTSIGTNPFLNCSLLESLTVDSENEVFEARDNVLIETRADGKKAIKAVAGKVSGTYEVPADVAVIGTYSFQSANDITELVIPKTVEAIEFRTFSAKPAELTTLTIKNPAIIWGQETSPKGQVFQNATNACPQKFTTVNFYGTPEQWTALTTQQDTLGILKTRTVNYFEPILDKYEISYELNGGTAASSPAEFTEADTIAAFFEKVAAPEKEDKGSIYALEGWYTDAEFTNKITTTSTEPMETLVADGANSLTLYAKYADAAKYTFTYTITAGAATITKTNIGTKTFENLTIPSKITEEGIEYPVVAIGASAFATHTNLKGTVTIPEGVKSIGEKAFMNCYKTEEIVLPESLESIGNQAFYINTTNTEGLKRINIPKNVTSIGINPFINCTRLETITVDEDNTVFEARDNVLIETRADGKKAIKAVAAKVSGTYEVPADVAVIGTYSFQSANEVTELIIPKTVESIEYRTFSAKPAELTTLTIKNPAIVWGQEAATKGQVFQNNTNNYPQKLTTVNFYGTEAQWNTLKTKDSIGILKNLTVNYFAPILDKYEISYELNGGTVATNPVEFTEADTIASFFATVVAPEKEDKGTVYAFEGWYTDAEFTNKITTTSTELMTTLMADGTNSLTVYANYTAKYTFTYTITDGAATITGTSIGTSKVENLTIPSKITEEGIEYPVVAIGEKAFKTHTNLTGTVTISEGIKTIGASAFYQCYRTEEFVLPESLETIGDEAFNTCVYSNGTVGLRRINIPKNVTTIGNNPFLNCTLLESLTVDVDNEIFEARDNVLIETRADGKKAIKAVAAKVSGTYEVPADVVVIGTYSFQSANDITELIIPETVESIEYRTFSAKPTELTTLTIKNPELKWGRDYEATPGWVFQNATNAYPQKLATVNFYGTEAQWNALVKQDASNVLETRTINIIAVAAPITINEATYADGTVTVSAALSEKVTAKSGKAIIALYDGEVFETMHVTDIAATVGHTFENVAASDSGYTVTVFCWSALNTMIPICDPVSASVQ